MYANGRAKGPGRWTRRSLAVSRKNDCKPLPMHLQIHPMRMTPTSRNPDCKKATAYGMATDWAKWEARSFLIGKLLQSAPARWRIDVAGKTFYTDDAIRAQAWVSAANHIRHRLGAVLTLA